MSLIVNDIIDMTRFQLDESSTIAVSDAEITRVLNRGQRKAANIFARKNDSLFWTSADTTTTSGQRNYTLPDEAYGERIEMVEVFVGSIPRKLRAISRTQASQYIGTSTTARPYMYTRQDNEIHVFPTPSGGLTLRIHYNRRTEPLVKSQGRITTINTDSQFILVDELGADISTTVSNVDSGGYVNFIDYNTGAVLGSAQVSAIDTTLKKISFKTASLTDTSRLGKTISTSMPTALAKDDYICLLTGTCAPEIPDAYQDYLIQYAVVEIKRAFNENTDADYAQLREMEKELERSWVGRENTLRKNINNGVWRRNLNPHINR